MALSATVWLSLVGAPLGVCSGVLGVCAIREARISRARSRSGIAAVGISVLAFALAPFWFWSCNSWLVCV